MVTVTFRGIEDYRSFDPQDLALAGASLNGTLVLPRHTAVEVSDEVAAALQNNPTIYGTFDFAESTPDPIIKIPDVEIPEESEEVVEIDEPTEQEGTEPPVEDWVETPADPEPQPEEKTVEDLEVDDE